MLALPMPRKEETRVKLHGFQLNSAKPSTKLIHLPCMTVLYNKARVQNVAAHLRRVKDPVLSATDVRRPGV